jgi:beta-lactamase class A
MIFQSSSRYIHPIVILILLSVNSLIASNAFANSIIDKIKQVERGLAAEVGVAIYDTKKKSLWNYNGDVRFPLMSTFKTLACAKLLMQVDKGDSDLDSAVIINQNAIVTYSPITKNHIGKNFTLRQACSATMIMSDNTAANIILEAIGGPQVLTQFLRNSGDSVTRLDRIEPQLNEALKGDLRDTTTPNAMIHTINNILLGDILSDTSKHQLKQWMQDTKIADSLLRSVLPKGFKIADRTGSGGHGSRGITALVWSTEQSPIIISIYLTQTNASFNARNKAIAMIGKEIFKHYLNTTDETPIKIGL